MKNKLLLSALLMSGLILTGCGEVKTPDDPNIPNSGESENQPGGDETTKPDEGTTPDTKPEEGTTPEGEGTTPDTKPDEGTTPDTNPDGGETNPEEGEGGENEKNPVTTTISLALPDTHFGYSDYSQDKKTEPGKRKEDLRKDVFAVSDILDTNIFEIYNIFGPNNNKKVPNFVKFGNGGASITVGLNTNIIKSIESIKITSLPHVQFTEWNNESNKLENVFKPDSYKISIDGENFKESTPRPEATSFEEVQPESFIFSKEECSNLTNELILSTGAVNESIKSRCYMKSIEISYIAK